MFFGNFTHNLDEKGRLVIPSKMREALGSRAYILKGYDGALSIYPESDFLKLVSDMEKLPFHKKTARAHLRAQMSSVSELLIDRQGRALLPTSLLAKYHIGKEVVVIGALDHIEVWNKEEYEAYDKVINDSFEDNAELLGEEKD